MKSNDSLFSTHLSYLYAPEYPFTYLRLELLAIIALWGKRHYKGHIVGDMDMDSDKIIKTEAGRFRNFLDPRSRYFDSELKRIRPFEKGVGIRKKHCYVTDTLLVLLGYKERYHGAVKSEWIAELTEFLTLEAARIKRDPDAPIYRKRTIVEESDHAEFEIQTKRSKPKQYVAVGKYKKLTKHNVHTLGSLSLLFCYGAACLKYFFSSATVCRTLFEKQFSEGMRPYSYSRIARYILNGSHEEYWWKETSSDSQILRIAQYTKDYLNLCMQYAHLHLSNLKIENLAAMLYAGIKFEMDQTPSKPIRILSAGPIQLTIQHPLPA